ncbi:tryptophan/tyrosine permease [Desulfonatronum sp. SC1]|nr:tryptophan/tyrosine permease [Desulfonatronum sp. SC1]
MAMDRTRSTGLGAGATIAAAALIAGNLVGAGILGLPINTGLAGLWPSLLAMVAGGAMMFLTAQILGDQAARSRSETFDYPSLYETFLGSTGKWAAIAANMIILYGLLTAYFTGGAKIVASLLGMEAQQTLVTLLFAVPLITLTCINLSLIQRLNTMLVLILAGTFALLVFMGGGHIDASRMSYTDWAFLPATLPIIVTAFHFHNIIPTVTANLRWDMATFRRAVLLGMLLAFVMNALWVTVGIGVIPLTGENSILDAWKTNTPATVPMGAIIQSTSFTLFASFFALVAICTSFLANGLGLLSFLRDLTLNTFGVNNRLLVVALTFLPPLAIGLIYPDIFLKALDIVGGVGIVILFGILPTLIVLMDRRRGPILRLLCLIGLLFAAAILGLEIMSETGLLRLHPHAAGF